MNDSTIKIFNLGDRIQLLVETGFSRYSVGFGKTYDEALADLKETLKVTCPDHVILSDVPALEHG